MNETTEQLARRPARDYARWAIPFAVLSTATLWAAGVVLLATDRDPTISTAELAVFSLTSMATATTILCVRHHLLQRDITSRCAAIRDDVAETRAMIIEHRARLVVAAAEGRELLNQMSATLAEIKALYWQDLAEDLKSQGTNGSAIPISRRRS